MGGFVYLDESGDTGFKFNRNSSEYFVITILLVDDPLPLSRAIDDLRERLHYDRNHEFKFTRSHDHVRRDFLKVLRSNDLKVRALIVDKRQITAPHMREAETFYNYLVQLILRHDGGRLDNATIILDERSKGTKNKQGLATYLRRELNSLSGEARKIDKIRYHQSHRDNLLQAVDMARGAIRCAYANNDQSYLSLLRVKIDDLWEFRVR